MRLLLAFLFSFSYVFILSCTDAKVQRPSAGAVAPKADRNVVKRFEVKPVDITGDFSTWYNYTYYNIKLSRDFIALNKDSAEITIQDFLMQLQTGKYIPIKILEKDDVPYYKLYPIKYSDPNIGSIIRQMADSELERFKMMGKVLPAYNWTDLNAINYTNENTKGKFVVVKCWFINCVACVKEFPELNQVVEEYKDRADIVFISLAMDAAQPLKEFLGKKDFKYAVVPGQDRYMADQLKITAYPTHIVVGTDGKIRQVCNNAEDLKWALNKELAKGF